jgi:hypothetical protein
MANYESLPLDDVDPQLTSLPAYSERWDGRRMIKLPYIDLFKAELDPFIEGLRSFDGKQEMGGGPTVVPPISRESNP